jgi:hypothetical protein
MLPSPRWNTYLLTLLWASQLGSALFLEYWAVLLLPFFPPRPGHWGSPFLFVWIVGNLLVLISVPVEAWQYGIEALTSSDISNYRLQRIYGWCQLLLYLLSLTPRMKDFRR